jgi:hypothetical protein
MHSYGVEHNVIKVKMARTDSQTECNGELLVDAVLQLRLM